MNSIHQFEEELIQLERTKSRFLIKLMLLIPSYTLFTFLLTFVPLRGSSFAERVGSKNSLLIIGSFFLAILVWEIIRRYKEYKCRKFDIETDIALLESKMKRLKE